MNRSGHILIVTGPMGVGKSTFCAERVAAARSAGWEVAGVLSPGRWADGAKIGIDVVDLRGGEVRRLAHGHGALGGESAQGAAIVTQHWAFDAGAMAWANDLLAASTPCDLLVVDELGPLEWEQGQGWRAGLTAVDTRAFVTALVVVRPSLVELALARWPDAESLTLPQ